MRFLGVLLVLCATANAGFFDDVGGMAGDVGNFFTKQFTNVKELFAGNQGDLEKNVDRVKELLRGIKEKASFLEPLASDSQKATLKKIDSFSQQINSFQNQVKTEGAAKFDQNKGKWEQIVKNIFETGGLNDIVKLIASQSSSSSFTAILFTIVPLFLLSR